MPGATSTRRELGRLPPPRAVLFDLDGTLVDTVRVRIEAWTSAFAEAGIPVDPHDLGGLIGSDGRWLAHEVARRAGREVDDRAADHLDRRAGERYGRLNVHPRPLPGATSLLAALERRGVPFAIATSSGAGQVARSVEALGLPSPPTIVDGSHVERAKPAPDLLHLAADRLGVEPRVCWYVGDATWDMLASAAAGMVGIGVATGAVGGERLRAAGARAVIDGLSTLARELEVRGLIEPGRA